MGTCNSSSVAHRGGSYWATVTIQLDAASRRRRSASFDGSNPPTSRCHFGLHSISHHSPLSSFSLVVPAELILSTSAVFDCGVYEFDVVATVQRTCYYPFNVIAGQNCKHLQQNPHRTCRGGNLYLYTYFAPCHNGISFVHPILTI